MSTLDSSIPLGSELEKPKNDDKPTKLTRFWRRTVVGGILVATVVGIGLTGFVVSREPKLFDPVKVTQAQAPADMQSLPSGAILTATVMEIGDTLLSKPGGFLSNDTTPPFSLLDNMPSWEYGVLTELRDTVRAMRNDFGRAQSQSVEDRDLVAADAQFHFSPNSWMLPSSENEYHRGVEALGRYFDRITDDRPGNARFFARADNLNFYLATVEKRLGNVSQRLSASARLPAFDSRAEPDTVDESVQPGGTVIGLGEVSWWEADNIFFEARGYLWALVHTLKALEQEFAPLLASKQATVPMHEIILKLELAQQRIWSPVILTNSGFGVLTNHSLVLASYLSRANAAIIDLRTLLSEG
jgi:hypothetical protein